MASKRLLVFACLLLLLCCILFDQADSFSEGGRKASEHKHKHKHKKGDKRDFTDQELGASSAILVCNL